MKEISRRSMYSLEEGIACGPISMEAIDAEIVVEDAGTPVYLHAQWVSEGDDEIIYEATKECVYDVYEKITKGEGDFDELIAERDRIDEGKIKDDMRYLKWYVELEKMIEEKKLEHGIGVETVDEEWLDEEDSEEDEDESIDLLNDPEGVLIKYGKVGFDTIFKLRLGLEAQMSRRIVERDMDPEMERKEKERMEELLRLCDSESDYLNWVEEFIKEEKENNKDKRFVTVDYSIPKYGDYTETGLEEELPSFKRWIESNEGASMKEPRKATEEEIELYLRENAANKIKLF